MTESVCVLEHRHDPDRPRRAVTGLLVCAGHQIGLSRMLRQLPPLHAALDAAVARGGRIGGPVVSGSRNVGVDLDDDVTLIRRAIRHKLATWALLVAEECDVTAPDLTAEHLPPPQLTPRRRRYNLINPRTGTVITTTVLTAIPREVTEVAVLVAWLARWHDWLLGRDYVDDWAQDIGDLHSEAWARAYPSGRQWRAVADCPADGCPGLLRATLSAQDDLLPSRVICTEEPEHTWQADQWRALRRALPGREEWLSIAALSQLHGIPSVTLYRWAAEDGWRSVCRVPSMPWRSPGRHPALYHADEVEAAVTLRRAVVDI